MSYDLMVFEASAVAREPTVFMEWYGEQTNWSEPHDYDDPKVTSSALSSWFKDMIKFFPMMNGPYATDDFGHPNVTDYSIGKDMIYMAFSWPCAEEAYYKTRELAEKHKVGFFDVNSGKGDIIFPKGTNQTNTNKPGEGIAPVGCSLKSSGKNPLESIPKIRKMGAKILKEKGFLHPAQESSYFFAYQEFESNRICFHFSIKALTEGVRYSAECTFISNELGKAINFITGKEHRVFPSSNLCSQSWRELFNTTESFRNLLECHSTESIELAEKASFKNCMDDLLSTIDRPGSHQLWHIAALACTKDKEALKEFLYKLDTPDRGGLFHYINQNYLNLALEYVESNP